MNDEILRYFKVEARELLQQLGQGFVALEEGADDAEMVPQLFRWAHTLKGAARVVSHARIAEIAHAVEDALQPFRDEGVPLPRDSVGEFIRLVAQMGDALAEMDAPPPVAPGEEPAPATAEGHAPETLRVELSALEELLDGLAEAVVRLGGLREAVEAVGQARHAAEGLLEQLTAPAASSGSAAERTRWLSRTLSVAEGLNGALTRAGRRLDGGLGKVEGELSRLRDASHALRLVPASTLFGALELAAHEAAALLGKRVTLQAEGGDVRLDGHVLAAVRQALLHAVRNAVDHGLEMPEERIALGKPEAGRVLVRVERRGARVRFLCEDDGRGVDLGGVRDAAVARGLVLEQDAASLDEAALLDLLFQAGFSTARSVTDLSGRGVGLDVVREIARNLKGEATAATWPSLGTSIILDVPVSLTSLEVLEAEVGPRRVLLPLDALSATVRLPAGALTWMGPRASFSHEEQAVPFLPLATALGNPEPPQPRPWSAVVLGRGEGRVAVGVDRLRGIHRVVVRPLPASVPPLPLVAGASFDAQGEPLLVMDMVGLAHWVRQGQVPTVEARVVRRRRVLVIDDSVTTRMLEQGILESAGYQVDLAASGEEGLEKVSRGGHSLVIVDVEMPGMSGLDFTRKLRAMPALASLPVIMVSSLGTEEDQRRGREAGVSAYIVKGEFDQHGFLDTVARLSGGPTERGR
ncbi:response regulator [Stigmatella sp. ncwal1]|uniref:histidine kinase n=1 Tax=Stigmatella ashevillensis TaxID=2995309 RepID=A0ABT5DF64_9BACT|nr:response regulator [Stigmatella ashevillena]MDC0712319.1 response regulator [Stigmatella ashevillena]